jgi:hypothetical protein
MSTFIFQLGGRGNWGTIRAWSLEFGRLRSLLGWNISCNFFLVQIDKIPTLFELRARDMPRRRQNIEAKWVMGKILRNKDLEATLRALGVVADFNAEFAHMSYSLLHSTRLSKGCSSQSAN